jgi:hypothetical protein
VAVIGCSVQFVRMFVEISVRSIEWTNGNTCSFERLFASEAGGSADVNPRWQISRTFVPGTDV